MKGITLRKQNIDTGTILQYSADTTPLFQEDTNTILIDSWTFQELCALGKIDSEVFNNKDLLIHCGGWQSWSAGWELNEKETLPQKVLLIPELIKLTNRDRDTVWLKGKKDRLTGHFIMYIRSGDLYLCVCAKDCGRKVLPPVSYRIERSKKTVTPELFCPNKEWKTGEAMAEIVVFHAKGYFNFKDTLKNIYCQKEIFKTNSFLINSSDNPLEKANIAGGYESWYNHYTNINEKIILEDLYALGKTENLIKLWFIDRNKKAIFQIDDGWEKAVGEWDVDASRFPNGLKAIAEKIEGSGYIPGIWLAPFLVTRRSKLFSEKPEWILKESRGGKFVAAGFNPLWDNRYYCLDISRSDVLEYIEKIIDRAIDEWGFRYLKLDFLYAGMLNGFFAESGSPYQHYEKACAILTKRRANTNNLPVTYLGCGIPLGSSFKHFPLSRIGADTREEWDWKIVKLLNHVGRPGAYISLMDTIGRAFLNGTVYINDPDVIFLRSKNCKLSENEKELIALVNFVMGGQIMFSDDPLHLKGPDILLTKRVVGLYEKLANDEYGAVRIDKDVFRLESRSEKISGIINLSNKAYKLNSQKDVKLHASFTQGIFLLDHRKEGNMSFLPHTISIVSV
jgi:alpha-galactosidase